MRALIGSFAMANQTQFNRADGAGYDFIADTVLALDPQESAGRRAAADRAQELARARARPARACGGGVCNGSRPQPALSRDVGDIVQRALAANLIALATAIRRARHEPAGS